MLVRNPNDGLANANPELLLLLQGIIMRNADSESVVACEDVNKRILFAVSGMFSDDHGGVSIDSYYRVKRACEEGIAMFGPDSPSGRDYRKILCAVCGMMLERAAHMIQGRDC